MAGIGYNQMSDKGFAYYAQRAAHDHGNAEEILKQVRKNDLFIKRAIEKLRPKRAKEPKL